MSSTQDRGQSLFDAARVKGVPFTLEKEPQDCWIKVDDHWFHYLDWGNETLNPLILLHGGSQQAHTWDFIALSLCNSYHIMAIDARGHGDSQWAPDGDYSEEAHQHDLDGFVDQLSLEGIILIGHSMGGKNAFIFASRRPEKMHGLIIVDIGPEGVDQGKNRIRNFRLLPDELDTYNDFAQRVQEYTNRPLDQIRGSLKYNIRQMPQGKWTWKYDKLLRDPDYDPNPWPPKKLWDCVAKIECPTLIIQGEKSDVFSQSTMNQMLKVIPYSTSAVIPKAGHLVAGDNPTAFLVATNTFLQHIPTNR